MSEKKVLVLALWLLGAHGQNSLRGSILSDSQAVVDDLWRNVSSYTRILQVAPKFFEPLACDEIKCGQGSTTWKELGLDPTADPVVIPCGLCVTMNYDVSDVLELTNGLDIQGALIFPNGYSLTLKTPFVLVQGNLEMLATRRVSGEPDIKFLFTGTNQQSFIPADNNKFVCSNDGASTPTKCKIGSKPFVVAGGKVTIHGIHDNCVTWANLHDVVSGGLPTPDTFDSLPRNYVRASNPFCHSWSYMNEDFSSKDNPYGWTGGYGALFDVTADGTFRVSERMSNIDQGPTWDMLWIRSCLIPNQKYLFSTRVKLTKAGTSVGDKTACAVSDDNCLTLFSSVRTPTGQFGRVKESWEKNQDIRFGKWYDFHATFEYNEEELNPENIYQIMQLRGPEAGVDIEIDDVQFSLPDPKTLPDASDVCGGNMILNGNAEAHSIHPYPMSFQGGFLSVEEEANGNRYFRHTGRTSNNDSPIYSFSALGCLVANGRYKVSVSLRIDSDEPIQTVLEIRSQFTDNTVVQRIVADCPGVTRGSWTACSVETTLQPELLGDNLKEVRLQLETIGAANLDMDVDNLELELLDGSVTSIIVPDSGIVDCWGKGAEILITSHTLSYEDSQVRTLTKNPTPHGDGFVKLDLGEAIVPPTTNQDSRDFAVEVALLSRNILFEGDTDSQDDLMGAHFMIMQTPTVAQLVDGAEFRNFGQQGILGRYPIHFHMCADATGSTVKRNSIRESNQRCIVIHGSNGVLILENVAYETQGHCYMLEDGGEVDNIFQRNLGAKTMKASRPVSAEETDHLLPSTFWCTNPQNSWIENVAAGSKDNGFWFELRDSVRGPTANMPLSQGMNPRTMALKSFSLNVAHSNGKHGIRTYPHGYLPSKEAVFMDNRSYRNMDEGIFLHNSKNIAIKGGILADNRMQVDLDRADKIRLEGTSIVGLSESFRATVDSQAGLQSHSDMLVGIQLHGYNLFEEGGAQIRSVSFSGFDDTGSNYVALIDIDDEVNSGSFDYLSSVSDVTIEGDVAPFQFDFTKALASGVEDAYIVDLDSSMKPKGSTATGVSSVVSNSDLMKTFLSQETCQAFPTRGYMYCADTCIRTITYAVNPAMTEGYQLRITNDMGLFVDLQGNTYEDPDPLKNDWLKKKRQFVASLPLGSYDAFFHIGDGQRVWPSHAEVSLKDALCDNSLDVGAVQLDIPDASNLECEELVRNGDIEESSSHPNYWLQDKSGIQILETGGISGTHAIADVIQNTRAGALGQFLDTRCLKRGRQYEIQAWIQLARDGTSVSCDSVSNCPVAKLEVRSPDNAAGSSFSGFKLNVASSFIRPYKENGWNMLHGTFTVDARVQAGASVSFFVERQLTGVRMSLDNVSVRLLPNECSELVFNGDFMEGTSRFWETSTAKDSSVLNVKNIQENWALEMTGRSSQTDSPRQHIRVGCMSAGSRFLATARLRLSNSDGSTASCDSSYIRGNKACPRMRLRSFVDVGLSTQNAQTHDGGSIAVTDHEMTADGWYTMTGVFSATDFDEQADRLDLYWDQVSKKAAFIVDNVSIVPLPQNCKELILNGDMEYDETPRFWRTWTNGGGKIAVDNDGSDNHVLKVFIRGVTGDGIYQYVDPECINESDVWSFTARMKLVSKSNAQKGVTCQPGETAVSKACPPIRIMGWNGRAKVFDKRYFMTNRPTWSANSYNTYKNEFTVNPILAGCDRVAIAVRQYNLEWDVLIDDISVTPT